MSHNIGKMFYYGERPWHGLGAVLDRPANLEEALYAGGLDWEVERVPITPAGEPYSTIEHRLAVVRKDRASGEKGRVIGVVHPGFKPLQNRDGAQLFDSLFGQGGRVYHTGGYLKEGEVVWLLARLPSDIQVNGQDIVEPYLLYSNSHDGSQAIDIRLTTVRVVCNNTLSVALDKNAAGKAFHRAHNGSYELVEEEAKAFFDIALKQTEETQALFRKLAQIPCEQAAFERFLKRLMPNPAKPATAKPGSSVLKAWESRCKSLKKDRAQIEEVRLNGIPSKHIPADEETWWGALNAVTGWADHLQKIEGERYAHSLMGQGERLKSAALKRIRKDYVVA